MRVAVLIFGQPRIAIGCNYNLQSLEAYKLLHKDVEFDTYIHQWTLPEGQPYHYSCWSELSSVRARYDMKNYMIENYRPVDFIFEDQKSFSLDKYLHPDTHHGNMKKMDISNMLSQVYSVTQVCNLVEDTSQYSWFVLLRTDCEIDIEKLPLLNELSSGPMYMDSDFLQIFDGRILELYKNLLLSVRDYPVIGPLSAERMRLALLQRFNIELSHLDRSCYLLRSLRTREFFIDYIRNAPLHEAWVSDSGVYCRRLGENHYLCKFPAKSQLKCYQWIGIHDRHTEILSLSENGEWKVIRDVRDDINFIVHYDAIINAEEYIVEIKLASK